MVELRNWSVEYRDGDGFMVPEMREKFLVGTVTGHPLKPDGMKIVTSRIKDAKGRVITCFSRDYLLVGEPKKAYLDYLGTIGHTYDADNPVMVIR